jgi:opacity protein-like surface antigen
VEAEKHKSRQKFNKIISMKKLQVFVVAIFCFVAFNANAQMSFGGTLGLTMPMGDFGTGLKTGFGLNVIGKYSLADNMAVGASVGYSSFGSGSENISFGVIPITGIFEYSFGEGAFKPYIGSDLGLYMFRSKITFLGVSSSSSSTYFGFAPTAGVMYDISDNLSFCANAKYNFVMSEGSNSTWIGLNAGIIFKLGK